MRQARLKAPDHLKPAYYHCVTRVVGRAFLFDEEARDEFVKLMRMYEKLSGLRVLTYAVMSDHVHLLIQVPKRPKKAPATSELLLTIREVYGQDRARAVLTEIEDLKTRGAKREAQALIDSWLERMWDVSPFMKTLKQRFTQWFNRVHERRGTLWEDRYRSVLVDGNSNALALTAAYIDLNAVRAKLVDNPADYRWCGYGESKSNKRAKEGIEHVAATLVDGSKKAALTAYKNLVEPDTKLATGKAIAQKLKAGERLPPAEMLRAKVRYFTDGAVLGSKDFVEDIFKTERKRFGVKRKNGARAVRGLDKKEGLCALRNLQRKVFG